MGVVLAIIGMVVAAIAFVGWIFMLLWNWIMPYLFGAKTISWWMALGIMVILSIMFGGIRYNSNK